MTSSPAAPYVVEADGGARGNPGPAGYGAVVKDPSGAVIAEVAEAIGTATNNVAEYRGLIAGLTALSAAVGEEAGVPVEVRMDSKLVIEQMSGRWKVKHANIRPLAAQAAALARRYRVTWRWVPREQNAHADRLANEAMDAAARGVAWRSGTPPARSADQGPDRVAAGEEATEAGAGVRAETIPGLGADAEDARPAAGAEPGAAPAAQAEATPSPRAAGTGWMPRPARTPTTLLLLRHGETPLSVEKRFSGIGDPMLTPRGLAQAEAAAARLSREPYRIDVIVSSPLKRALQTAEAVAAATGVQVVVDEGLRETDFGAWEGHTFAEIQRRWPDLLTAWLADPAVAPPGGESFEQAARRVEAAVGRIVARYPGRAILVVSHVTPIKTILRLALLAPPAALHRMHLDIACLSVVDYYADGPAVVRSINDTAHLR
ncbi:MAG: bifunctional RNase H/acid phosphatase [Actinomycetes bacterium]|nr:MAG: bifunctional RNase H/acid phosphatase [Actinomycetota bacterium]